MVLAFSEIFSMIHVLIPLFFLAYMEKPKTSVILLGAEDFFSRPFMLFRMAFTISFYRSS